MNFFRTASEAREGSVSNDHFSRSVNTAVFESQQQMTVFVSHSNRIHSSGFTADELLDFRSVFLLFSQV